MLNQPIYHETSDISLNPFTEELLDALLQEEDCYPWNLSDPETESYLTEIEDEFFLSDELNPEDLTAGAEIFFGNLHQRWSSISGAKVRESLSEKFGKLLPSAWLENIIEQAEQTVSENLPSIHQLVTCVQPLWTNWGQEDLQVFARPLAYAMRGTTTIKQAPWEELSEIERIRLSLVVAQEALNQLSAEQ